MIDLEKFRREAALSVMHFLGCTHSGVEFAIYYLRGESPSPYSGTAKKLHKLAQHIFGEAPEDSARAAAALALMWATTPAREEWAWTSLESLAGATEKAVIEAYWYASFEADPHLAPHYRRDGPTHQARVKRATERVQLAELSMRRLRERCIIR